MKKFIVLILLAAVSLVNAQYLGSWDLDETLYFTCNTHDSTAEGSPATDADAEPTYRVYENETATPIDNGTLTLIDAANTAGFYSEALTLTSAGTKYEAGKSYTIYVSATVDSVVGTMTHNFQILADTNTAKVADATPVDWTGGTADLIISSITIIPSGAGDAVTITGGTSDGSGIVLTGGASNGIAFEVVGDGTGEGLKITGGDGSGTAISVNGGASNGIAIDVLADGTGEGLKITGGDDGGDAIQVLGGSADGYGIRATGRGAGEGILASGGTTGNGFEAKGGSSSGDGIYAYAQANNDAGMKLVAHGTGDDLEADDVSFTNLDYILTAFELDGAVYRLTTNALELAPSGSGGGGGAIY